MLYIWKLSSILCRFEDNKTLFVTCWGLWKCRTWAAGNTSIPPSMIRSLTGHRLPYSVRASRITRTFGVVPCGTTFVCWLFWGYGWLIFGVVGWGKVRGHYWGGGAHLTTSHRQPGVLQGDQKYSPDWYIFPGELSRQGNPYETRGILTSFTPAWPYEIFLGCKNQSTLLST